MQNATRDTILSIDTNKICRPVQVEYFGIVHIRAWTERQRQNFVRLADKNDGLELTLQIFIASVIDEASGEPMFKQEDKTRIAELPAAAVEFVAHEAMRFNGMLDDEGDVKNG